MKTDDKASKRLVFVITGLNTGGAEMMLYKLLSHMNREQFEPVVISLMGSGKLGGRITALGIPVLTIGMEQGKPTPTSLWRLIRTMHQLQPNLIQGWMTHGNLAAQFASVFIQGGVPVLWSIRHSTLLNDDVNAKTLLVVKLLCYLSHLPKKIIYNSKAGAYEHEKIGYKRSKTHTIFNGFDTELFVPSVQARHHVRLESGLSEETLLIGLIGRFHPMKDHINFLQAAALLLEKKHEVHFILAGKAVDWDNQILHRLILKLKLSKQVHLLGERDDIPWLTAALDIASNTSSYGEGFPNVIGEAMACGVPCVVTDVGDSAWIVGDTGQVVPAQDPEALCAGWLELIDMGVEARCDLGTRARQRIEELFSIESIILEYERLYQEVIYG